ncbi:MAG: AmmeMemoRadiSam system protein B [Gemmatimonadetes bacterium]|nr:AmmeMemoRadiSam system protein B [Gemmatimonadota bacterium]
MPPSDGDAVQVRPAAVAGRFYSDDRHRLTQTVAAYLAEGAAHLQARQRDWPLSGHVRALVCPHAGYVFSGPIAGSAYSTLQSQCSTIHRVVLIGPAHRVAVPGLAVPSASALDTPLGTIAVDPVVTELVNEGLAGVIDEAHEDEHALEVHLPFLQIALSGDITIVPLLFGQCDPLVIGRVIERLWESETLFVISSDLSHFHSHDVAERLDQATSRAIESLDAEALGEGAACGRLGIQALIEVAIKNELRALAVDVRTSADTAGSPDRVVGYGAYVFHE